MPQYRNVPIPIIPKRIVMAVVLSLKSAPVTNKTTASSPQANDSGVQLLFFHIIRPLLVLTSPSKLRYALQDLSLV